jgi:SAM-dependent methyltransferase
MTATASAEPTTSPPAPFDRDTFTLLRNGVYDDDTIRVLINEQNDFALLDPRPSIDYTRYTPRFQKLDQAAYRRRRRVEAQRHDKLTSYFRSGGSVLEIGAGNGLFLGILREHNPDSELAYVEPDEATDSQRAEVAGLTKHRSVEEAVAAGKTYDTVCFFHLLEHILDPGTFLDQVRRLLHVESHLVIEVPSLDDPLRSVYGLDAFEAFYFQRQHPYVYSSRSLERLMAHNGFETERVIAYQRYGLENHLGWIRNGRPGGDPALAERLASAEPAYRAALEAGGQTDTAIWVGKPGAAQCP